MNEPLTMSRPGIAFSGKTNNKHPQWYNQPLRLTQEQKRDPLPVLDDFFECYHLNEVRQTLWEWLTEVLSSQRSIAIEPLDRNNHIYFYEKIEGIIEAAFILKNKIQKRRRKKEKRLTKINRSKESQSPIINKNNTINIITDIKSVDFGETYGKPAQLIEYVDETPIGVIVEVFKTEPLYLLRDQMKNWLTVAISADCSVYEDAEQRGQLLSFQDQLLVLIEALFIIYTQQGNHAVMKSESRENDQPQLLTHDQIANPMKVVTAFFDKFPLYYCIRELNDWLEAAICFAGTYPDNMNELQALYTYRNVLCLIRSAHRLIYPITA
ncbi:hypothetical protein [Longitalea arenae]|uniref:hypothetical protein n=1 Tax=Longitalea arenae TaxID=2812558 RepID=UPI0019680A6C|nr:hypothetical protein [Longitalea arenae]